MLKVYGGTKEKSFYERVQLVNRATEKQAPLILHVVKGLMG